jgi:hypothetical protein
MKKPAIKSKRICVVCGTEFNGTGSAITCDGRCRTRLARIKDAKKRPEFLLVAKSNGQKLPDFNAPKRVKFKKGEKKQKAAKIIESKINYVTPTPESYDAPPLSFPVIDEMGQFQVVKEQTPTDRFKIMAKISELERKIKEIEKEPMPPRMLPKQHALYRSMKADPLKDEIKELEKLIQ